MSGHVFILLGDLTELAWKVVTGHGLVNATRAIVSPNRTCRSAVRSGLRDHSRENRINLSPGGRESNPL